MSRSYRHNPIIKDGESASNRFHKRQANKKIRNSDQLFKNSEYKKLYEQWNIHDYIDRTTYEEFYEMYHCRKKWTYEYMHERFPTWNDALAYWKKTYFYK